MRHRLAQLRRLVDPALALVRLSPFLLSVRRDRELRPILRSYLGWMPLCVFSEPLTWMRMLLGARRRFRDAMQRPASFYVPHLPAGSPPPDAVSALLEEAFPRIREEYARIAPLEVDSPSRALVASGGDGEWKTFPLMRAAKPVAANVERCPETWATARRCPLLSGIRGGVYFSIIYPGTHVTSHCGPSNLKVRYHLGIEAAEGARIRSGREWYGWQAGKCFLLDDSVEHEVVHDGDARRVVLIVDCWHPGLTAKEREFLTRLHRIWRGPR